MGVLAANNYKCSLLENVTARALPDNTRLNSKDGVRQAIAEVAKQKKTELAQNTGLKCEECFRVTATSRCIKCECVFCALCFEKVHSSSHTLRRHKPYPISKTSLGSEAGCPEHKNRPHEFFDRTENLPVCSHCAVTGERHGHDIVPISDVVDDLKQQFKSSLEDGQKIIQHLERSQKKLCQAVSQAKSQKTQLANEIREHFHYVNALLQIRETALIKELETPREDEEQLEMSISENIKKSRNVIQDLEVVLMVPTMLMNKSKEIMDDLKKLKEMPCVAVKTTDSRDNGPRFVVDKEYLRSISNYGGLQNTSSLSLQLKKLDEAEDKDLLDDTSDEEPAQSDQPEPGPEILDTPGQEERSANLTRSVAAAKLLSIPYRHELVQVTHIRDPCYFMVQRLAEQDQVNAMMNAIQIYCREADTEDLVFEVNVGDMVCAQFSADNLWYRARVINIFSDNNPNVVPTIDNNISVEVTYMDFGNTEWLPLTRMRKMPTQFLEVPDLAVNCSLMDIVPPFKEEKWPAKAIKAFGSLTGDKPLLMTVLRRRGGSRMYVDLKNPDNDEPTHDDDRPASVRDALVFLEVACFRSPASVPEGHTMFPMRSYKDPVLLEDGQFADVLVSHVTGPDEIFLQKLHSEEVVKLSGIMNEMLKLYNTKRRGKDNSRVLWPYRGLVCAARFSEDKVWYRAVVTAVYSDETVDVSYVDYGNFERLAFSEIRKLPDIFLNLPKQAIHCQLVDIKPFGEQKTWSDQTRETTCNLLLNKSFVAQRKGLTNGVMDVILTDTSTDKDLCINSFLVMIEHAQTAGLGIIKADDITGKSVPEEQSQSCAQNINDSEPTCDQEPLSDGKTEEQDTFSEGVSDTTRSVDDGPEVEIEEDNDEKPPPEIKQKPEANNEKPTNTDVPEATKPENKQQTSGIDVAKSRKSEEPEVSTPEVSQTESKIQTPGYPPPVIPQARQFQAGVTYVGMDGSIYAQEMKDGDQTLINIMKDLLRKYTDDPETSSAPTSVQSLAVGQPCAAQFADDGMWYRAVVSRFHGNDRVEVNYVDFGNSELVALSALRTDMPYLHVPRQCLQLRLHGIRPATPDGSWSPSIISKLNSLVVGKDCVALQEGEAVPGKPLEVRLCLPEGISITELLLAQGLVRPTGQAAVVVPSPQVIPAGARNRPPPKNVEKSRLSAAQAQIHAMLISAREADSMVSRTELPQIGVTFDVTVTHVSEPDCIYIQRVPPPETDDMDIYDADPTLILAEDELERLERMAEKINGPDYFKNFEPLAAAQKGMLCCGQYTEDDMWYRAQVISVESGNPLSAHVRYIDYGNDEVLPPARLRGFPSELLDLPIQATRCRLADIQPPGETADPSAGSSWPEKTKDVLIQIVVGKTLTAKIVCFGPPVCILLYDRVPDDGGAGKDISVGKLLAEQQLAKYIGTTTMANTSSNKGLPRPEIDNANVSELKAKADASNVALTSAGSAAILLSPQEFLTGTKKAQIKLPNPTNVQSKDATDIAMTTSPSKPCSVSGNVVVEGQSLPDQGGNGSTVFAKASDDTDAKPETASSERKEDVTRPITSGTSV
ncbi:RING finger protein 17 isoform X3 [Nematostella vectensis]|uniref:RING finger protein 17 isoform X3 n=1 Tax=Nematostella vectensis TaxID=45351 RepID=UPI0020778E85|nr:RING finger protein 17 isoform X3 [Nematostella vectensis]